MTQVNPCFHNGAYFVNRRLWFVIGNNQPLRTPGKNEFEQRLFWTGIDDRGLELEIAGVEFEEEILVIHVMPTIFRRKGQHE